MANKFILNQEDGTVEGGNIRGIGSVDLQTSRTAADQVAGTDYSAVIGGENNTVAYTVAASDAGGSSIIGGQNNCITLNRSFIAGGCNNFVCRQFESDTFEGAIIAARNSTVRRHGYVFGGHTNSTYRGGIVLGGNNNVANNCGVAIGSTATQGGTGISAGSDVTSSSRNLVVGNFSNATGTDNLVVGRNVSSSGSCSMAVGGFNSVTANFSVAIGGAFGAGNQVQGTSASILGGSRNIIYGNGDCSVIGGGCYNYLQTPNSFIGGGYKNCLFNSACDANSFGSVIVGGVANNQTGGVWDDVTNTFTTNPTRQNAGKFSFVGGGRQNVAWGINSTVGGGTNNKACGCYSTIAGGVDNGTYWGEAEYSFIGGGCNNCALRDYGVVAGGLSNDNQGIFGFIGAGCNNVVSGTNPGVIVGGKNNTATGGLILGGTNNTAASCASVGGGNNNASGGSSTVFGFASCATNSYAVALGYESRTTGSCSSVLGGYGNGNDGQNSSIGGGWRNCITSNAPCSFIGSGCYNRTNAGFSTIHGGTYNCTDGVFSIASGNRSRATLYGQKSHASGNFNAVGDAQVSTLVARAEGQLTASSGLPLFLDGATELIVPLGTNRAWNVTVDWVAIVQAVIGATGIAVGDIISQKDTFGYKRILGTGSIVGTPTTVATFSDASMTSSSVTYIASAGGNLDIRFDAPSFGAGDVIFNVVARVSLTEVAIP